MNPVVIVGVGACTAIGRSALASAAAVRSGVAGFTRHPFMIDGAGNPPVVAMAPYVDADLDAAGRLAALAGPAASEAAEALEPGTRLPVFVGLPPHRPGASPNFRPVVERIAFDLATLRLAVSSWSVESSGHAAGLMAVRSAWQAIRSGQSELALAGGVDSYIDPEVIEWLENNEQLHSAGLDNNPYGFIPGEAAAFVLLASSRAARRLGLGSAVELLAVECAHEPNRIKTETVCTGEGLTALFRMLASAMPDGTRADGVLCDMNGEPYRADEFGFATIRAGALLADPSAFIAPADCWGDVGAASGPLYLVLADTSMRKRYAAGPVLAGFTSAESGERCGFIARALEA